MPSPPRAYIIIYNDLWSLISLGLQRLSLGPSAPCEKGRFSYSQLSGACVCLSSVALELIATSWWLLYLSLPSLTIKQGFTYHFLSSCCTLVRVCSASAQITVHLGYKNPITGQLEHACMILLCLYR